MIVTEWPLSITIPFPTHIPRARGIHSTNRLDGGIIRFRSSRFDAEAIQKAAELCDGMSVSSFCRYCAVQAANHIIELHEDKPDGADHKPD